MAVGVDEARNDDPVRGIDGRGIRHCDAGTHLANLAVFDQHIGVGKMTDLRVHGQHHTAFQ